MENNEQNQRRMYNYRKAGGLIMGVFYLIIGTMVLFWEDFSLPNPAFRLVFGAMLIVYGSFRLIRGIRQS